LHSLQNQVAKDLGATPLLRAPAAALVLVSVAIGILWRGTQNCLTPFGTLIAMKASGTCASKSAVVTLCP